MVQAYLEYEPHMVVGEAVKDRLALASEGDEAGTAKHRELVAQGGLYERLVRYQQMEKSLQPGGVE